MKLLKPAWVNHDGMTVFIVSPLWAILSDYVTANSKPIFSIDIHPDGSRFATGGQGENSGKVMIWNLAPVRDEAIEKDDKVPKMLCLMENHLGCVNCVRWSNNGRFLASGGDDKLVMIWQVSRYGGTSTVFGSDGQFTNVEQWRVANVLRGHSEDVLDLAWSPHDAWLATCSVDNTIIVWNALKLPEQLAVLRGHSGMVKGVTWDPVGKYLASQSDDKSVRVWRTSDWQQESCIEEPFQECGGTTHVLRLNWSPDGHYIVSAHAMNNSGPTAQIIERDGWKATLDFVGHRKAITCVRFNPNILRKRIKKNSEKSQQYTCCAIGSRDRCISVWLTALKRPLVVNHDLFKNSILDISWNINGVELMCCSADGTVAYLSFDETEIGKPISTDEKIELHRKIYGKSLVMNNPEDSATVNMIIESSAMLQIQQKKQEEERKKKLAEANNIMANTPRKASYNTNSSMSIPTPTKQIETRTKDGKRRITPIFLSYHPDISEGPVPFAVGPQPMFSSSKEQSCIVREKMDSNSPIQQPDLHTPKSQTALNKVKDTPSSQAPTPAGVTPSTDKPPQTSSAERTIEKEKDRFSTKLSVKRKLDSDSPSGLGMAKKKDRRGRPKKEQGIDMRMTQPMVVHTPVQPSVIEKETRIIYTNSGLDLPVPEVEKASCVQVSSTDEKDEDLTIEIENCVPASSGTVHKLRGMNGVIQMWENLLTAPILAVSANSHVVCAACKDRGVTLHSMKSGRKLLPCLMLDSRVHRVQTSGYYAMVVTSKGSVYVWNVQTCQAVVKNESLISIIPDDSVRIDQCMLTEQGLPVISLSTGYTYTYKIQLACWAQLHSKVDLLQQCSDYQSCVPRPQSEVTGTLANIQNNTHKGGSAASRLYKSGSDVQQSSTLSYLENQVSSSYTLQSKTEYHFWFMTYVRYLVQEGFERRLREVCEDLLGPLHKSKTSSWEHSVLGYKKRSLLEECLPIIGTNLNLQRFYTEFHEQLETVKY